MNCSAFVRVVFAWQVPPCFALEHFVKSDRALSGVGTSLQHGDRLERQACLQDAADIIRKHKDKVQAAAKALADEAMQRGSTDNISCVVIRFAPKGA